MAREFGGYLEAERFSGRELHEHAIALNNGRNCLRYLIRAKGIRRILLPWYNCDAVTGVCEEEKIGMRFYPVDERLRPCEGLDVGEDEYLYLVNYFGLIPRSILEDYIRRYQHVIVDNVQAFFEEPFAGADTLYTCRKFFGVTDGAYLYMNGGRTLELEKDCSCGRMEFLYGRLEKSAGEFFAAFQENEELVGRLPLAEMSETTRNMMRGISYETVKKKRTENYQTLARSLGEHNLLDPELKTAVVQGPYMYPFLAGNGGELKRKLIQNKIFVPTLWPNVREDLDESFWEYRLAQNLLPLPCDQRYTPEDMNYIANMVLDLL